MTQVSSPVFIGRRQEVEHVVAAIEAARGGLPSLFFVGGEAGVGKTRFVEEVAGRARAGGGRVLLGGCIDLGGEPLPFAPVVEALRGLADELSDERLIDVAGPARTELARLLPNLGRRKPDAARTVEESGGVGLSYGSAQGRLFELLLGLLTRLGTAAEPVLLVIEDLHWGDRSTLDLLAFLARNLRRGAVVVLVTYRTDELHRRHPLMPFLAEIERGRRAERIELRRFDRTEIAAQVAAILGSDADRELVDAVFTRSEGNAFFTEELLAAGLPNATGMAAAGDGSLPPSLRDVLLARIAALSEPTQDVLRQAAAGGREIPLTLLTAVTGLDERRLTEALREAVRRQILVPHEGPRPGGPADERYAFRHALAQEAIYGDLLPGERARLHAAYARALEAGSGDNASGAAALAHHWYAAHDLPRALAASVRAGDMATSVLAFAEAQALYERGLELWELVADPVATAGIDQVGLLERAAHAAAQHALPRAIAHLRGALALVDRARDPARAALLLERLGQNCWEAGDGEAALAALQEAVLLVPAEPPDARRGRVLASYGQILMLNGRFRDAGDVCREAIDVAQRVGDRAVEAHALDTFAVASLFLGDTERALPELRRSLEIAIDIHSPVDIVRAYNNLSAVNTSAARFEEALEASSRCYAEAERLGLLRFFGPQSRCETGSALYFLGRWDEARREFEAVLAAEPEGMSEVFALECAGTVEAGSGRFDAAHRHLSAAERLIERTLDPDYIAPVAQLHAELALWEGHPAEARAAVAEALERIGRAQGAGIAWLGPLHALGLRAEADLADWARDRRLDGGVDRTQAAQLLDAVRSFAQRLRHEQPLFAPQCDAFVAACEGEWSRVLGASDAAIWEVAAAAWESLSMPYPRAYALWRRAEAMLAGGREGRGAAVTAIREAHAIAERLGAQPLHAELTALASRARIEIEPLTAEPIASPVAPDALAPLGLTRREREVFRLVAAGRTNRQIAETLFISEKTAGVHVSNILGKLGVGGRVEAAAMAYRLGLRDDAMDAGDAR